MSNFKNNFGTETVRPYIVYLYGKRLSIKRLLPGSSTYHPSQRGEGDLVVAALAGDLAFPDEETLEPQEGAHAAYLKLQKKAKYLYSPRK